MDEKKGGCLADFGAEKPGSSRRKSTPARPGREGGGTAIRASRRLSPKNLSLETPFTKAGAVPTIANNNKKHLTIRN